MTHDCKHIGHVEGHAGSQSDANSEALSRCGEDADQQCFVFDSDGGRCDGELIV
jgi:hypothetical protein